ncbi:MAG: S8 family serine peptidase [Acidobacteria bacterium]|nr:S8 family serine peptidase [Acidobacteriota bacterium]
MRARNIAVRESLETVVNSLIVDTDEAGAAEIATLPGVLRVIPARSLKLLMDRAPALHRVGEARALLGSGKGGAGVKIAVIDSGVDQTHASMLAGELAAPAGFPKAGDEPALSFTSGKVIVARSYVSLLPNRDPDNSPRDRVGHGTAVAAIAAGVRAAGPLATVEGMAPDAWIGNYKVFGSPGSNDGSSDDVVMKAIDDAVADGMDIINLSLGSDLAPRLEFDPLVEAIERATAAGVLVVTASGNNGGSLNTLSSPATAPSSLAAGASTSDRILAASAIVDGVGDFIAVNGSGTASASEVSAPISDVSQLDGDGLGCGGFAAGSLNGRVALVLRGICPFETKINNAQRAGAVAALVYAAADAPGAITMSTGAASLPAQMIGHVQGSLVKNAIAEGRQLTATLRFTLGPVPIQPNEPARFSGAGPSVDLGLKPDLLAVGQHVYTATQSFDNRGDMYSANGFIQVNGTSFSAPMTAGAAAMVKAARPGLSPGQVKSLLVNAASPADTADGYHRDLQLTGAGLLNVESALRSTVTAVPSSLSLGAGGANPNIARSVTLTNISTAEETYFLTTQAFDANLAAPVPVDSAVTLAPGASRQVSIRFQADNLAPGAYQGMLAISPASTGQAVGVPYWYAVASNEPAAILILDSTPSGRRGANLRNAVYFRVIDAAGLAITTTDPEVSVTSGDAVITRLNRFDGEIPGLYTINVQLGLTEGTNVFRIQAGGITRDVTITGN